MIVTGQVDREGRLIAADPRLARLHKSAGGVEGGAVAVPQIATLARLARTLGILVSRPIVAAEGETDLELLVRARPEADMVHLSIGGWTALPQIPPTAELAANRAHDFARLEGDGAWETDAEMRITRLSSGLGAQIVSSPHNAIGQPMGAVFQLINNDDGAMPILKGLAERIGFTGQKAEVYRGSGMMVALAAHPIFDASGHFLGLSGSFVRTDILADEGDSPDISPPPTDMGFAQKLDAAIRKPLGRIIADADAISIQNDGPIRQDYAGYANDISSAGRHLLGLVDDLSDLQAIERPDFQVEAERIDLADIARRAAGLLGVRAADNQVRIDKPDTDEVLFAVGEFRRLLQIMVNLVGNAVRYSPPGGMVWIRTEEEGDLAAVIVADMGKGIADEDQERIFEKFERVDPTEPGGSGLGLYIARKLARAMGGDITVDSALGRGARFVLTLPRARGTQSSD
jgi:two-component sensor histidine kinase